MEGEGVMKGKMTNRSKKRKIPQRAKNSDCKEAVVLGGNSRKNQGTYATFRDQGLKKFGGRDLPVREGDNQHHQGLLDHKEIPCDKVIPEGF